MRLTVAFPLIAVYSAGFMFLLKFEPNFLNRNS